MQALWSLSRRHLYSTSHAAQRGRFLHRVSASLISIDRSGIQEAQDVNIWLGEEDEAFALVPSTVSEILRKSSSQIRASSPPDTFALAFDHGMHAFIQGKPPSILIVFTLYPRSSTGIGSHSSQSPYVVMVMPCVVRII